MYAETHCTSKAVPTPCQPMGPVSQLHPAKTQGINSFLGTLRDGYRAIQTSAATSPTISVICPEIVDQK